MSSPTAPRYLIGLLGKETQSECTAVKNVWPKSSETETPLPIEQSATTFVRDGALNVSASVAEISDEALLSYICEGKREALACLFRRYGRLIRAVAYKILRDESEADDLLQDVFLFIYSKSQLFDSAKNSARSWIVQMTYHRAIDRRRYLNSRHFYTRLDLDEVMEAKNLMCATTSSPQVSIEDILEIGGLTKSLENLTENQRRTLQLHFFDGYTLDEIATKLDQTRGNIKNHYFRGLEKLRKQVFGQHRKGN